jgi:hypothetical protein
LFDSEAEVVHLLAAFHGRSGNQDVRFGARTCCHALHDGIGGVGFGSEDEEDFVVLEVEFGQRGQVAFQARLKAFTGAQQSRPGRIKAGVGHIAPARIIEPLQALQKQIEAERDLQNRQYVKSGFHVFPA